MALLFQKRQLCKASMDGDLSTVKSLLTTYPKLINEALNPGGQGALYLAASKNHFWVVHYLLSVPDVNFNIVDKDGWTPLSTAARNGHTLVVRELLKHPEVDINHQDNNGKSPLYLACYYGYIEVVEYLLNRPNVNIDLQDNWQLTAHDICCDWMDDKSQKPVIQKLIEDFELKTKGFVTKVGIIEPVVEIPDEEEEL